MVLCLLSLYKGFLKKIKISQFCKQKEKKLEILLRVESYVKILSKKGRKIACICEWKSWVNIKGHNKMRDGKKIKNLIDVFKIIWIINTLFIN